LALFDCTPEYHWNFTRLEVFGFLILLERDPFYLITGETPAAGEFSVLLRLKAYPFGTVLVGKVMKNPGPGFLADRRDWVTLLSR
jgi:hypothetical protein